MNFIQEIKKVFIWNSFKNLKKVHSIKNQDKITKVKLIKEKT